MINKRASQFVEASQINSSHEFKKFKLKSLQSRPGSKDRDKPTQDTVSVFSGTNASNSYAMSRHGLFSPKTNNVYVEENNLFTLAKKHQNLNQTTKFKTHKKTYFSPTAHGQQRRQLVGFKHNDSYMENPIIISQPTPVNDQYEKNDIYSGEDDSYLISGNRDVTEEDVHSIEDNHTPIISYNTMNPMTNDRLTFQNGVQSSKKASQPYHQSTTEQSNNQKVHLKPIKIKTNRLGKSQNANQFLKTSRNPNILSPLHTLLPIRFIQAQSTKAQTNCSMPAINGGVTNLISFKMKDKLTERQQQLLEMQKKRDIQIKESKHISKEIKKNFNKKFFSDRDSPDLMSRSNLLTAPSPINQSSHLRGGRQKSNLNSDMILNPSVINVDEIIDYSLNQSDIKTDRAQKYKKVKPNFKEKYASPITQQMLENKDKLIAKMNQKKPMIYDLQPQIDEFIEREQMEEKNAATLAMQSIESINQQESIKLTEKSIQRDIGESVQKFFQKENRMTKVAFEQEADDKFKRQISTKLAKNLQKHLKNIENQQKKEQDQPQIIENSPMRTQRLDMTNRSKRDQIIKNNIKFSKVHLQSLTKGSYLQQDSTYLNSTFNSPSKSKYITLQNSTLSSQNIIPPQNQGQQDGLNTTNPFNFDVNVPNFDVLNSFRQSIQSNQSILNRTIVEGQAPICQQLTTAVNVGKQSARDKIFKCEKVKKTAKKSTIKKVNYLNDSINIQDQNNQANTYRDELDIGTDNSVDMINKLKQFVGSNQDDFLEYDDSLIQTDELDFTINQELDFKDIQKGNKKTNQFNNVLLHQNSSLSQKYIQDQNRYNNNSQEFASREFNIGFGQQYQNASIFTSPNNVSISNQNQNMKKNPFMNMSVSKGQNNNDILSHVSLQFFMEQQKKKQQLKNNMISPLTELENKFLEIANDLLGDELANKNMGDIGEERGGSNLMERILSAREEVKETKHSLQKLLQRQDEIYIKILGEQTPNLKGPVVSGPPTLVELLPNIEFHLKIDIEQGSQSPVFLRMFLRNQNGDDKQQDSLTFAGSFHHKFPNLQDNEIYLKNPDKVAIACPSGEKKFKERQQFYISITSSSQRSQNLTIKCFMRGPPKKIEKKKKRVKKEEQSQTNQSPNASRLLVSPTNMSRDISQLSSPQSKMSSTKEDKGSDSKMENQGERDQQPPQQQQEVKSKGSINMLSKLRENIQEALASEKTRDQVIEQMEILQKKRRILNFLRMQFGSQNPYAITDDVIELEQLTFNYQNIDLNQKIRENIQNVACVENDLEQVQNQKQIRQIEALYKQKENEIQQRVQKINCLNKWDNFRESRSYYVNIYLDLKKKQTMVKGLLRIMFLQQMINKTWNAHIETVLAQRAKIRMIFMLKRQMGGYKFRQRKLGKTLDIRMHRVIKNSITFQQMLKTVNMQLDAKALLLPFFMQMNYRYALKLKFRNTIERIIFIQQRFRNQIKMIEGKVIALKKLWAKECRIMQIASKKNPNDQKLKRTLKRYKEVPEEIKEACFRRFIQACKHKHALQFFAWREKFAQQRIKGLATAVLQSRMIYIKQKKQRASKIMGIDENEIDLLNDGITGISRRNSLMSVINSEQDESSVERSVERSPSRSPSRQNELIINKRDTIDSLKQNLKLNFKNVSQDKPVILNRTVISKYTIDAKITKESVMRIKSIQKQLEGIASGEDPEILYEHIEDIDNVCNNKSLINSFEEINLNDPFPPKQPKTQVQSITSNTRDSKQIQQKQQKIQTSPMPALSDAKKVHAGHGHQIPQQLGGGHCDHSHSDEEEDEIQVQCDFERLNEFRPPMMIFIPQQIVMRKLMNLCASVNDFSDLFYFL